MSSFADRSPRKITSLPTMARSMLSFLRVSATSAASSRSLRSERPSIHAPAMTFMP
jgi:hypothetical protein